MPSTYSWDPAKDRGNLREHGIGFEAVKRFDWETAWIRVDDREDYGELREITLGFIGDVLYDLVFSEEDDEARVISLRKATSKERKAYAKQIGRFT